MSLFEFISDSHLVSAALATASGLILFAIMRREGRVRPDSLVMREHVVAIVFAPLITVLILASAIFTTYTFQTLSTQPPNAQQWALAVGAALITVIVWTLTSPARAAGDSSDSRDVQQRLVTSPGTATG